jgi:mono/diheme cytochrome c family protein
MVKKTNKKTNITTFIQPTAADLGNLGSREWMRSIVVDYAGHLAAIRHSESYQTAVAKSKKDDETLVLDLDSTDMADWSGNREALVSDKNKKNLDALIEFMVSRANHKENKIDKKLAELGKAVATDYDKWVGIDVNCAECHTTIGNDFDPNLTEFDEAPDIAEYASGKWLRSFISNPGSEQHYGAKNLMPAYKEKMTEKELDLLVRWFTKDHFPTEVEPYPSKKEELRSALQPKK